MHNDMITVPADGVAITVNRDGSIDVVDPTLGGTRGCGEAVTRHMDD